MKKEKMKERFNKIKAMGFLMGASMSLTPVAAYATASGVESKLMEIFGGIYGIFFMVLRLGGVGLAGWGLWDLIQGWVTGQGVSIPKALMTIGGGLILIFSRALLVELIGSEVNF